MSLKAGDILGILDTETDTMVPFSGKASLPFVSKSTNAYQKSKRERGPGKKLKTGATSVHKNNTGANTSTLFKHKATISMDKYDLGLAKDFTDRIHLKDDQPIFRKQFNLPEAHTQFI